MSARARTFLLLTAMAAGVLVSVGCLQYILHVGSCGNGPNSLAYGFGPCPGGIVWRVLGMLAGLFAAIGAALALGRPLTTFGLGLGFTTLGAMFAVLGFVPAPGDAATFLGLAIGAPFLLGGLVAFGFTARFYR
ncbi:MAG: hypothetical protein JWM73_2864 [Solirubrobacterales bacterium]|jgi:hypothetical protein|nr:hypothetical protein [Solirubrobacterales bacterium]